jgi:beta-glucosidase
MFMAPDSWRDLYKNTVAQVRSGEIGMERLDEAVRRILRVKFRAGLFDKGAPSKRAFAGRFELLGSPDHRAVARQAVRESLVLLKNNGGLLPLTPRANVLVAGDGADNISKQSGGWTITWQGTELTNADFPNAQSIFGGIREAVAAAGGTATLNVDGRYSKKPDVAIMVFGENPYAEFAGDRPSLEYSPEDKQDLELLRRLRADGIPVVSIFLSGRPLWVNPELNTSDAFVAAFLPGSEGGGVADVLFRDAAGKVRHDFKGKLSYSWPRRIDQTPLNVGDANYDPLFAYGFGLTYADKGELAKLPEDRPAGAVGQQNNFFARGTLPPGWSLKLDPAVQTRRVDRNAQEDSLAFTWTGKGEARIAASQPVDISREATGQLSLIVDYRLDAAPVGQVELGMASASKMEFVPITRALAAGQAGEWQRLIVPLRCFAQAGLDMSRLTTPLVLRSQGNLGVSISGVRVASAAVNQSQCGDS